MLETELPVINPTAEDAHWRTSFKREPYYKPDLGFDDYGPAYRERLRRTYAELSAAHATGLVPFFLEGVALQPGLMQADGLHPTAKAQPRLLQNVWPVLEPLL